MVSEWTETEKQTENEGRKLTIYEVITMFRRELVSSNFSLSLCHKHTHAHKHTRTQAHTHTRTHTHTHTEVS
jgi:ABC-type nickel/cobalt efflux system permease component RcnA